jgi:ankyrin repeat protein
MQNKAGKGPSRKESPLCRAAQYGHLSIVLEFINRGASIQQVNEDWLLPLRHAACYSHPDVFQTLLKRGASVVSLNLMPSSHVTTATSRLGFTPDVDPASRSVVLSLLNVAEEEKR